MNNLRHEDGRIISRQPITPGFGIASIYWRSKGIGLQHPVRHLLVTKVPKFHPPERYADRSPRHSRIAIIDPLLVQHGSVR